MDFNWPRDMGDDKMRSEGFYRTQTWEELFEEHMQRMYSQPVFSMKKFKKIPWEKEGF